MRAAWSKTGSEFTMDMVSDMVSDPPYASFTVNVATIEEPTGRALSNVSVVPLPRTTPVLSSHSKVVANVSASTSEVV